MTAPTCLACEDPLVDAPSLKERLCADCAYELDLLPEAARVAEMARLMGKVKA